jgi:hypothetical protein
MCPKWFLSLLYVQRKPCNYLASRLGLCPNEPKWASTWAYDTFGVNLHLSCTHTNTISKRIETRFNRTHITEEFHRVRPNRFSSLWYFHRKLCTNLASKLALSPNGPKRVSSWDSQPRSTIGCIQNDFWAYGTFGTNHTPILHRH